MDNQEKTKKKFYKKWWFWVIVVIVFIIIVSSGDKKTNNTTTQQKEQKQVQQEQKTENNPTQNAPTQTVAETQYQEVFKFSGNGAKKSEPFTITGDRFKIAYDCKGDLCQAFMYKVGSTLPQVIMNTAGTVKDETIMYGKGEYYLDANTMGSYTMTVYDFK